MYIQHTNTTVLPPLKSVNNKYKYHSDLVHCKHDLDNGVVVQTDFLVCLYLTPHSCLVCFPSLDQYPYQNQE